MEYIHGIDRLLPRVSSVEIRPDYHLLLTFRDGEKRLFDVSELLNLPAYRTIKNVFSSVRVEYGTVVLPPSELTDKEFQAPLKPVMRKATPEDAEKEKKNLMA